MSFRDHFVLFVVDVCRMLANTNQDRARRVENPEGWRRVAEAIERARKKMGWTVKTLTDRAGVSRRTIDDLRTVVRDNYGDDVLGAVEDVFYWPRGSIRQLAAGDIDDLLPPDHVYERLENIEARMDRLESTFSDVKRILDEIQEGR